MKPISIYIHIPFCVQKCKYCDFLSAPATRPVQEAYLRALKAEIRSNQKKYADYAVQTIFIGGGTPTAIEPEKLCEMITLIKENFTVNPEAEISMEANPGTVTAESLKQYKKAGINRLSIGLQSAEDTELRLLGRIHNYADFLRTYYLAAENGFTNINVDLMSALPGQTVESYVKTLKKVLSLKPAPKHISAYSLIIEEGTPFYESYGAEKEEIERTGERKSGCDGENKKHLPSEEEERLMYKMTEKLLKEAGYARYEISNYSLPGYACRHNTVYWRRGDYVGFGLGAASLVDNIRFHNTENLQAYLQLFSEGKMRESITEIQALSVSEQMEEFMFLGLRMTAGVSKEAFYNHFGVDIETVFGEVIDKNKENGLLKEEKGYLFLTGKGLDVSNYVMAQFLL